MKTVILKVSFRQDWVAVETQFHTFMKRMIYSIEESSKYYSRYTFEIWELQYYMLEAPFPTWPILWAVKVINMSFREASGKKTSSATAG